MKNVKGYSKLTETARGRNMLRNQALMTNNYQKDT